MRHRSSANRFLAGILFAAGFLGTSVLAYNPPERLTVDRPTFSGHTARPLRYRLEGTDFVIENGSEFFNRPLYGGNTAFRVDAGDRPEVSLYVPGQAGNIRFGLQRGRGSVWLHNAEHIIARYRPGGMLYQISDPLLGNMELEISILALYEYEGLIVRIQVRGENETFGRRGPALIVAYGGAGGKRGARSGDIGCESEPISRFFQLRPDNCKDNVFTVDGDTFVLTAKVASMAGTVSQASLSIADAADWNNLNALQRSAGKSTERPVLLATRAITSDEPIYVALRRIGEGDKPFTAEQLSGIYEAAERQRSAIAERVAVQTPDPYVNAAVAALCAAADGIWDERSGSVMHGAVAWRSAYAGWRGPYANDAFGWHDRAKRHLEYWAARQNTKSVPDEVMGPDPAANLARSHPAKQSRGDIGGKHYDMNLVYIDTLVRHLLWTGDLALAEQLWPVIERHFDWQRRLFRRPFGNEQLPLYEAYAAIWASDDMQFNGGGVSYTSAYNYYHNRFIGDLAERLGKDPAPFRREADAIADAMRRYLWLKNQGWYAEYKDLLGRQQEHSSAGVWTFYHIIDSRVADPFEAWQMSRYVDSQIAHIPVHGGPIAQGQYYTVPTSNWMPYTYSTNNVVTAETAHTALAYWQAGRPDKAFSLFKGAVLDGMYMGLCPGNAGMTTYFDAARGEAQRDFGDAVGTLARAVVEGLFGIRPDAVSNTLTIAPGFPGEWPFASISHPDLSFSYMRNGNRETYAVTLRSGRRPALSLVVPARTAEIEEVTVNGVPVEWLPVEDSVGMPRILIQTESADKYEISIVWKGDALETLQGPSIAAGRSVLTVHTQLADITAFRDPQQTMTNVETTEHQLTAGVCGLDGHRTAFIRLKQGQMVWWTPLALEVRPAFELEAVDRQPMDGVTFFVRNNTAEVFNGQAEVSVAHKSKHVSLTLPAFSRSEPITLSVEDFGFLPGTARIAITLDNGTFIEGSVTNWAISVKDRPVEYEVVNLIPVFNDKVTQIFKHEYLSPRSPYCSLAIPKQGIGSWCNYTKTFDVDDSGLRRLARDGHGRIELPQGVPFSVPAEQEADNIIFTSQWDNFPDQVTVPLDGKARHLYLLMAGSTNSMQSRIDNGQVVVTYADGQTERLALHNPTTWWPIDQDYFIDDFGFRGPCFIPPRIHLKSGAVEAVNLFEFKGKGGSVPGGAATVLDLPLRPDSPLRSMSVQTLTNDVVIGLMSATLVRE